MGSELTGGSLIALIWWHVLRGWRWRWTPPSRRQESGRGLQPITLKMTLVAEKSPSEVERSDFR